MGQRRFEVDYARTSVDGGEIPAAGRKRALRHRPAVPSGALGTGEKEPDTFYRGAQLRLACPVGAAFAATAIRAEFTSSKPPPSRGTNGRLRQPPPPELAEHHLWPPFYLILPPLPPSLFLRSIREQDNDEQGGGGRREGGARARRLRK